MHRCRIDESRNLVFQFGSFPRFCSWHCNRQFEFEFTSDIFRLEWLMTIALKMDYSIQKPFLLPHNVEMIITKIKRGRIIREINGNGIFFVDKSRRLQGRISNETFSNEIGRSRIARQYFSNWFIEIYHRSNLAFVQTRKHQLLLRQSKRHRVLDIRSPSESAFAMFTLPAREPRGSLKY